MFKRRARSLIYKDEWIKFIKDKIDFTETKSGTFTIAQRLNGVLIAVITIDNNILLNKEFRYPIDKYSWELPGGGIDLNEKPRDAAIRELYEETGIKAEKIEHIGDFYPLSCFSTELVSYYLTRITNPRPNNSQNEISENITEQKFFHMNEAIEMIDNGIITDSATANAIQLVKRRLNL